MFGALATMVAVVAFRAEATRVQFEVSQLDRQAEALIVTLREQELTLAQLRNPAEIRRRAVELSLEGFATSAPAVTPPRPR